jgi:hypothetical protein
MKDFFSILALVLTTIVQASAAEKGIADYFLELPPSLFESHSPSGELNRIRRGSSPASFIDPHNGFMFLQGDGAQVSFQIALFRYANGHPLLAVSQGDSLEKPDDYTILRFFTERQGSMVPVDRAILPVEDSSERRFELPRIGLTLVVRNSGGEIISRWTWSDGDFSDIGLIDLVSLAKCRERYGKEVQAPNEDSALSATHYFRRSLYGIVMDIHAECFYPMYGGDCWRIQYVNISNSGHFTASVVQELLHDNFPQLSWKAGPISGPDELTWISSQPEITANESKNERGAFVLTIGFMKIPA